MDTLVFASVFHLEETHNQQFRLCHLRAVEVSQLNEDYTFERPEVFGQFIDTFEALVRISQQLYTRYDTEKLWALHKLANLFSYHDHQRTNQNNRRKRLRRKKNKKQEEKKLDATMSSPSNNLNPSPMPSPMSTPTPTQKTKQNDKKHLWPREIRRKIDLFDPDGTTLMTFYLGIA
jgi:hypothetical protein